MFNRWLSLHRNDYVVLYHGTSANIPVMTEGLRKTSLKTKRSIQSETGYVYLSLWPDSARTFGEISYPYDDVKVYAVIVKVQDLRPDKDQLFNKRRWDDSEKNRRYACRFFSLWSWSKSKKKHLSLRNKRD